MSEQQLYKEKVEVILKNLEERLDYSKSEITPYNEEEYGINFNREVDLMENDHEELSTLLQEMDDLNEETAWNSFKHQIHALVERFQVKYDFV